MLFFACALFPFFCVGCCFVVVVVFVCLLFYCFVFACFDVCVRVFVCLLLMLVFLYFVLCV